MAQRVEPVRDHDRRPAGSQPLHDVNQVGFRTGAEGAGGLIKNHDRASRRKARARAIR